MKFNANALKKDINLYMRTFGEAYIKDAVKQIENEAKNCVMYFYSTYTPKVYDRTYQFLDNSVTSKVWKSKGSFSGYIDLMSDITGGNMIYLSSELSDIEIRGANWNGYRYNADDTSPSPLYYLYDFFDNGKFNNSAIKKAMNIARNQKYSCIKK